jgi:predicted MFS family arabinose efflux permease
VTSRHVPESRDPTAQGRFDIAGAVLVALALAGITDGLIEAPSASLLESVVPALAGVAAGAVFVLLERRRGRHPERIPPMLPLGIFSSRQFTAINLITFVVYGAMGAVFFLLVLDLQVVAGFTPLQAGISLLPSTVALLLLSSRAGAWAQRFGPRWLMTGGLLLAAAGLALLTRIGRNTSYVADVLPAVLLFGIGLAMTVAPLTATVLASADERHAGVASGVNNATARAAGLLAVAGLPAAVGLSGAALHSKTLLNHGFHEAMLICSGLMVLAALGSAILVDNNVLRAQSGEQVPEPECLTNCAIGAPPLEPGLRVRDVPRADSH